MTRCASPLSNFPPRGERAIASSPACGRGLRRGFAVGAGMAALHRHLLTINFAGNLAEGQP